MVLNDWYIDKWWRTQWPSFDSDSQSPPSNNLLTEAEILTTERGINLNLRIELNPKHLVLPTQRVLLCETAWLISQMDGRSSFPVVVVSVIGQSMLTIQYCTIGVDYLINLGNVCNTVLSNKRVWRAPQWSSSLWRILVHVFLFCALVGTGGISEKCVLEPKNRNTPRWRYFRTTMPTNEHLTDRPCRFQSLSEPNSKPYFIPNNNPKEDSDGHSVEKVALVDLEKWINLPI